MKLRSVLTTLTLLCRLVFFIFVVLSFVKDCISFWCTLKSAACFTKFAIQPGKWNFVKPWKTRHSWSVCSEICRYNEAKMKRFRMFVIVALFINTQIPQILSFNRATWSPLRRSMRCTSRTGVPCWRYIPIRICASASAMLITSARRKCLKSSTRLFNPFVCCMMLELNTKWFCIDDT